MKFHLLRSVLVLVVASLISLPAHAVVQCRTPKPHEFNGIGDIIQKAEAILAKVEPVSPDVSAALDVKLTQAVKDQAPDAFLAVTEHPSYSAWQIRKHHAEAKAFLELSRRATTQDNYSDATRTFAAYNVLNALNAYDMLTLSIDLSKGTKSIETPSRMRMDASYMQAASYDIKERLMGILACVLIGR